MADVPTPADMVRLDSWKAIAAYLKRDESTVRRWERELGLPVRRVNGGRRGSVFAFASELDAWLLSQQSPAPGPLPQPHVSRRPMAVVGALLILGIGVAGWWWRATAAIQLPASVEASAAGIVGRNEDGTERWRYLFPADERVVFDSFSRSEPVDILRGDTPEIVVVSAFRIHAASEGPRDGQLLAFSPSGELRRLFAFDDTVRFGDEVYTSPWALVDYRIGSGAEDRRVAIAAHHYTWWPGLVTVLGEGWARLGTFVNAGWTERVHWLTADRLLVAGFSESRDGGMIALLDVNALNGQSPEDEGGRFYCRTCGPGRPLRYVVTPRTEVNHATASRFNRAKLEVVGNRVIVRTIEVPAGESGGADAIYEFTPSLELISASFSARYWELHRALEMEGKLDHSREQCPDRDGPRQVLVWMPATGWTTASPQL